MPVSGRFTKGELTALENSWLSFEGAIGPNKLLYDLDKLLQTKGQGRGLQLYTNMLNEAHTYAEFRTLARTITSKEWTVSAFSKARKDQKAADIVREQIENLNTVDLSPNEENYSSINGFDQLTEAFVISGVLHGRHFGEVMWQRDGSTIFASEIRSRDPRQFQFSKGKYGYVLRHMTQFDGSVGEEMPPRKIMAFCHGAIDGNPYGFPLGRTLFWPQFFKKKGILFWLGFVERFAQPKIVGKYPIGTPPDQITAFNEVLQQLNQDIETSIPDGMMIEYLEAAQGGAITTFESLTAFMDAQISRAILGETGTSDQTGGGGSRARDQVADDQKDDVAKGVSDSLSASFNRLSRWITELNVPGAMPPRIYRDFGEHEDLNTRASRDRVLFDMGYRLEPDSLIDIYGEGYVYPEIQGADAALIARFGVQGVQLLSTLLGQATGGSLPKENAVAILTQVFGLTEEQAGEMIPEQVEEPEEEGGSALDRLFGGGDDGEVPTAEAEEQADADPAFAEISAEDFAVLVDKVRPGMVAAIAPWIDSIGGLVAGAETMEEIRDQLIGLYPEMKAANFAEVLGEVMQTGDLIGRDEIADEELEFAEVLDAILPGTIDFAGKKKSKKKKPKSPKCTAGKSHFCKTPTGRGSCVSTSKKCRYKPNGAVKTAADYVGKQGQYKDAQAWAKAGKAGNDAPAGGGGVEPIDPAIARKNIDYDGTAGSDLPGKITEGDRGEIRYRVDGKTFLGDRMVSDQSIITDAVKDVLGENAYNTIGETMIGAVRDGNAVRLLEIYPDDLNELPTGKRAAALEKMALHKAKDGDVIVIRGKNDFEFDMATGNTTEIPGKIDFPDDIAGRSFTFDGSRNGGFTQLEQMPFPEIVNPSDTKGIQNARNMTRKVLAIDDPMSERNTLIAIVKDGRLSRPTEDDIIDGLIVRGSRDTQFRVAMDEFQAAWSTDPLTGVGKLAIGPTPAERAAKAHKGEDWIASQTAPIEDRWVGRNPTPGAVRDYESFRQESITWAKSEGLTDTANGFDNVVTAAHDVGHPIVHEMLGMGSNEIRKAFGVKSKKNLMAEEAIVNVAEHLSRGDDLEASVTNGLRVVRVLTRNDSDAQQAFVRTRKFKDTLTRLSWNLYKNDNYNQYMDVLRRGVRTSGLVQQSGSNFNNTAS